ncbi:MAG: response regulator transcription factor [Bacteroidia bacterium]|nr:response regulator transcription factor [Bacteroidia bacterium]
MNILIIEDEQKVAAFIKKGLEVNGYHIEVAYDGKIGLSMGKNYTYDLIILDVNLPIINGFDVCRQLRESNIKTPVLMLTALGTLTDKVLGFDIGADDYLVKPFEFEELTARVKALIKRANASLSMQTILKVADLELNSDSKTVTRNGKEIELTAKEFLLLEYLMRNQGKVLSRLDIAEKIWDISFDTGTNVIDLYIFYLRKKIDKDFTPKLIHTQIGMGYILKEK